MQPSYGMENPVPPRNPPIGLASPPRPRPDASSTRPCRAFFSMHTLLTLVCACFGFAAPHILTPRIGDSLLWTRICSCPSVDDPGEPVDRGRQLQTTTTTTTTTAATTTTTTITTTPTTTLTSFHHPSKSLHPTCNSSHRLAPNQFRRWQVWILQLPASTFSHPMQPCSHAALP